MCPAGVAALAKEWPLVVLGELLFDSRRSREICGINRMDRILRARQVAVPSCAGWLAGVFMWSEVFFND